MTDERHHADLAALLGWYRDMGADEALGEAPIDWLERGDAAPGRPFRLPTATPGPAAAAPAAPAPKPTRAGRPPPRRPGPQTCRRARRRPWRPPAPCSGPLPPCCRTLPSWGH